MFGSFNMFNNDPFFQDFEQQNPQMDRMMSSMMRPMFPSIMHPQHGGPRQQQQQQLVAHHPMSIMPFGNMFPQFDSMFGNMAQQMNALHSRMTNVESDPNAQGFSQSTVISYSNVGNGQPSYYEASSSTRTGPGGVRETRKTVRDSSTGIERMSVGHHIGDRAHIRQRERNRREADAQLEEVDEFVNIDEDDAEEFDREFQNRAGRHVAHNQRLSGRNHRSSPLAITHTGHRGGGQRSAHHGSGHHRRHDRRPRDQRE